MYPKPLNICLLGQRGEEDFLVSLSNSRIPKFKVAVEDRFIVTKFSELLANQDYFYFLSQFIRSGFPEYTLLCDCRSIGKLTNDIADGVVAICQAGIPAICHETNAEVIAGTWQYAVHTHPLIYKDANEIPLLRVKSNEARLNYSPMKASFFADPPDEFVEDIFVRNISEEEITFAAKYLGFDLNDRHDEEMEDWDEASVYSYNREELRGHLESGDPAFSFVVQGHRSIQNRLRRNATNSLLTTYTVQLNPDAVFCTPYHSHAIHNIEGPSETILLGRPGIIAEKTSALFQPQLRLLESLLNKTTIRESEIQRYLEKNPAILKALGYTNIYSQVILQRDDGTSLRPDFIVEPTTDEWCDIVDIKLPSVHVAVGTRDRKTLSAAIHELVAQLREYSAYFENEKWQRRIEQLYGIKCYRPRLVGVVGTDPRIEDDRQLRRLMTAYSDVKVMTFDQLLRHAKTRLLI